MINEYEREGFFDDDFPELPDYEETPPTPEQVEYAHSLVGKWVKARDSHPYSPYFGKVTKVNDSHGGLYEYQVRVKIFISNKMWDWRNWLLFWHTYDYTETTDSSWLFTTDWRPSIKNRLSRYACLLLRTPVRMFLKSKFEV